MATVAALGLGRGCGRGWATAQSYPGVAMGRLGLAGFCHDGTLRLAADRAIPRPGAAPPHRQGKRAPGLGVDRTDPAGGGLAAPYRPRSGAPARGTPDS